MKDSQFSLLDSEPMFGLSPPHDGSEFEDGDLVNLFPELFDGESSTQTTDSDIKQQEPDLPKVRESGKRVIHMKMASKQADELVKYLSGEHKDIVTVKRPCFQQVQDIETENAVHAIANSVRTVSPSMLASSGQNFDNPQGLSRNAIAARENRLKKKAYLEGLENTVQDLTAENVHLKKQTTSMKKTVDTLSTEVKYLRSVLANQSAISSLLSNIQNTPQLKFSSSFSSHQDFETEEPIATLTRKRSRSPNESTGGPEDISHEMCTRGKKVQRLSHTMADHCYQMKPGKQTESSHASSNLHKPKSGLADLDGEDAGVCLHVSGNNVSLEFCAGCSKKAKQASRVNEED